MDDKSVNSVWKYLGLYNEPMSPLKYANFPLENMPIKTIESLALWLYFLPPHPHFRPPHTLLKMLGPLETALAYSLCNYCGGS